MPDIPYKSVLFLRVSEEHKASLSCHWRTTHHPDSKTPFIFDILLKQFADVPGQPYSDFATFTSVERDGMSPIFGSPVLRFMLECFKSRLNSKELGTIAFKLILPGTHGYLAQTDFLFRRLDGCEQVDTIKSFGVVGQEICNVRISSDVEDGLEGLSKLLNSVVGAILLRQNPERSPQEDLLFLEEALIDRLSYPWIVSLAPRKSRIAPVEGRHILGSHDAVPRLFSSATSLGISLIVVDQESQEVRSATEMREKFLAIDMTLDDILPDRIAAALKILDVPVDGITSFTDRYLVSTAQAAEILGLPTIMSPDSLSLSTDKHKREF